MCSRGGPKQGYRGIEAPGGSGRGPHHPPPSLLPTRRQRHRRTSPERKINVKQLLSPYVCPSGNVQGWLKSIGSKVTNCWFPIYRLQGKIFGYLILGIKRLGPELCPGLPESGLIDCQSSVTVVYGQIQFVDFFEPIFSFEEVIISSNVSSGVSNGSGAR